MTMSNVHPLQPNGLFHKATYNKVRMVPYSHIELSQVMIKSIVFFLSEDIFCLSKQCRPDEMPHHAAFHLGLRCLPKYPFSGFGSAKARLN